MCSEDGFASNFVDDYINECPFCNKGIRAEILYKHAEEFDGSTYVDVMAKCPICKRIFWGEYNYENLFDATGFPKFMSKATYYPQKVKETVFSKEVSKISDDFVQLFHQGEAVEQLGMSDACGLIYRRALEYLIKDFAISLNTQNEEDIKSDQLLSNVINNRLPEKYGIKEIKEIAKRAWWLGNDYAHYTKHYVTKDISDLKECIDITQMYITLYLKYNYQVDTIKKHKK